MAFNGCIDDDDNDGDDGDDDGDDDAILSFLVLLFLERQAFLARRPLCNVSRGV